MSYVAETLALTAKMGAGMGRTNERIGRIQETYVTDATTSWLESLERSLAQMKEYQVGLFLTRETYLTIIVCTKEVGKPSTGLRYLTS